MPATRTTCGGSKKDHDYAIPSLRHEGSHALRKASRQQGALRFVFTPVRDCRREEGTLPGPGKPRREAVYAGLWTNDHATCRPDREEAAFSFLSRDNGPFHGHDRVQLSMPLVPKNWAGILPGTSAASSLPTKWPMYPQPRSPNSKRPGRSAKRRGCATCISGMSPVVKTHSVPDAAPC